MISTTLELTSHRTFITVKHWLLARRNGFTKVTHILVLLFMTLQINAKDNFEQYRVDDKKLPSSKALVEEVKLLPSTGAGNASFGHSVSLSGNRALIGAYRQSQSGAAYLFEFDGNSWNQMQIITAIDGETFDRFGFSVSLHGNRALIGATGNDDNPGCPNGCAYLFEFDGNSWNQMQKITAADGEAFDVFGGSVSLSDNWALIGALGDDDNGSASGAAYLFEFDGNNWNQLQKITAADGEAFDGFGESVSLSGNRALIGAPFNDGNAANAGSAYLFEFDGNSWNQMQKITAADGELYNKFGGSVSLSGTKALIGARGDDETGSTAGSAYLFEFDGNSWNQQQKITATDGEIDDQFGQSVSLSGNWALISATGDDDNGSLSGSAYLFEFDGSSWNQLQKITPTDGEASDRFGGSVSLSGKLVLIGASENNPGSAYIFNGDLIFKNAFENQ